MAEHKSPGGPSVQGEQIWPWVLGAHALVNAGGVFVVTGSLRLSLAEAVLHSLIDYGKGRRAFGFHADQALHVASKVELALAAGWAG